MENIRSVCVEYNKTVQTWKETPFDDLIQSAELMKDMAIIISNLTMHKIGAKKKWNGECFKLVSEGMTGTAAEKHANELHPELDQLRQVIRAGQNILDAIRSQVSLLKNEK